ncbi:hypothetical protein JTB14_004187 [Gonioctena quinquepunctata]|nr:hypothetical protein JTB14_004187 [Gonioctena quinquepunctata]
MIKALQSDYQNHINRATPLFNSTQTNLPVETQPKKPLEKTNTSRKSEKEAQEQNYAPNRNVAEVDFTTFINSNQNFEEEIAQVKIEEKNIDIFNIETNRIGSWHFSGRKTRCWIAKVLTIFFPWRRNQGEQAHNRKRHHHKKEWQNNIQSSHKN